jgi:small subunit ribosomal protein S16
MLVIRLKRHGKAHFATYRIVVQDSTKNPTSGKVVAFVGSYNPHSKEVTVNQEVAQKFLDNGAQPTPRVAMLLKANGVKLPSWVKEFGAKGEKKTRNPEKLRKNQPAEAPTEEPAEAPVEEPAEEAAPAEAATEEAPAAEEAAEAPAK